MNFSRPNRREDILFVIALLVPAFFSGARYLETDRQLEQIAHAATHGTVLAAARAPAPIALAQAELGAR
jgi:hypothetical protein